MVHDLRDGDTLGEQLMRIAGRQLRNLGTRGQSRLQLVDELSEEPGNPMVDLDCRRQSWNQRLYVFMIPSDDLIPIDSHEFMQHQDDTSDRSLRRRRYGCIRLAIVEQGIQ